MFVYTSVRSGYIGQPPFGLCFRLRLVDEYIHAKNIEADLKQS